MCVSKLIWWFVLVLFYSTKVNGAELTVPNSSFTGYGGEVLMEKLEYLQYKLLEIDLTMKEDRETVDQKLTHQDTLAEGLLREVKTVGQTMTQFFTSVQSQLYMLCHEMRETINLHFTILHAQADKMISQQAACANHEQMRKEIEMLGTKGNWTMLKTSRGTKSKPETIRSCQQMPTQRSGKYLIQPTANDEPFEGYCDHASVGGAWLVIQWRFDGSVDFYRNWTEYRNGFGTVDGEFWLGLERIHRLTAARPYELIVELKDFSGNYIYARYDKFEVGTETEQYALNSVGTYTGTAGDPLTDLEGAKFFTKDRDMNTNCVVQCKGAFWHDPCNYANLNGLYVVNTINPSTMSWYYYRNNYMSLASSRMMIREI